MSDTPRTDQHAYYFVNHDDSAGESLERVCDGRDVSWDDEYMGPAVPAAFARTIERENALLRKAAKRAASAMCNNPSPRNSYNEAIKSLENALANGELNHE